MNRLKLLVLVTVITAFAATLAACGSDDEGDSGGGSAGDEGEPIVIGFAMGFTGFANAFDGPVFNGAQIAINDYNADGGVDGRKFEIVRADTKSDLASIQAAALEVIEKGADVVVTTCDYDYGAPAAREAQKAGLLAIGCAGAPLYGKQGIGPLAFNSLDTTPNEAAVMAKFALEQGFEQAYLLADTSIAYSKDGCEYFREAFTAAGGTVVGQDTFQNDDSSIRGQVTRMADSDADFVKLCSYLPGVAVAVRQMRAGGVDLPIVGQFGVDGRVISGAVPNLSDLFYPNVGMIHGEDPDPELDALGEKYEELAGTLEVQDYAPILGYSEIQTIARAIEMAGGSTEGAELAKAIESFEDEPLYAGPTTYSEQCHTVIDRPMSVAKVEQGKVTIVEESVTPENVPEAPC